VTAHPITGIWQSSRLPRSSIPNRRPQSRIASCHTVTARPHYRRGSGAMSADTLKSHFAALTDEALNEIVGERASEYTAEALELARAEVRERASAPAAADTPNVIEVRAADIDVLRRRAAKWLAVIAALSLINTALVASGSPVIFVIGLGSTLFIDALFIDAPASSRLVGYVLSVAIAGVFIVLWHLGKRQKAALKLGLAVYALDALVSLLLGAWFGVVVHVVLAFRLWSRISAVPDEDPSENEQSEPERQRPVQRRRRDDLT
jgi:hypothetical protein